MHARWKFLALLAAVVGALFALTGAALSTTPMSGAIFTTDSACTGTNVNIFGSKADVYVDGGPAHPGAAGLPDGSYYVQVTAPDGTLLGTSIGSGIDQPVVVSGGEFAICYQLASILIKASDGNPGYDTTPNAGGEYKVWVSTDPTFLESATKTDNFKVKEQSCPPDDPDCIPPGPPTASLSVDKFYDANADGIQNNGDPNITGWEVRIQDGIDFIRYTPVSLIVDPDTYTVTESTPIETNWHHTTTNPVIVTLAADDDTTVTFGNVCTVAGHGGLTLGFWSNRNGQALINGGDLTALQNLNLRTANGLDFQPTSAAQVKSWLLSATATNMAYMLSAQLAATTLDVRHGFLSDSQLIYAPSLTTYGISNSAGFTTIGAVRAAADTELGLHGSVLSGSPFRAYQEALKNVLDGLNNNTVPFASATPCTFTFPTQ